MHKSIKISLIIIALIVLAISACIIALNSYSTRIVNNAITEWLKKDKTPTQISVGRIHVGLLNGRVRIYDINLISDTTLLDSLGSKHKAGIKLSIPQVSVNINSIGNFIRYHNLSVLNFTIKEPRAQIFFDDKHPADCLPVFPTDTAKQDTILNSLNVAKAMIENATIQFISLSTPLRLQIDSLSFEANNIDYSLIDSSFAYNDSIYSLQINHLDAKLDDGITEIDLHNLICDAEGLKEGYTHLFNTITDKKMAELAREPINWTDLTINHLHTSKFNPIQKIVSQDRTLDSVFLEIEKIHAIRNEQYMPKQPYNDIPQLGLIEIQTIFCIKNIIVDVHKINFDYTANGKEYGKLQLGHLNIDMHNLTNKKNATCTTHAHAIVGQKGHLDIAYNMHINKECTFDFETKWKNIDMSFINSFVRPLAGITCKNHIDELHSRFSGDKLNAEGEFMMTYHNLEIEVLKDEKAPIEVLKNNAEIVQYIANGLIAHSNPESANQQPKQYKVDGQRNEWLPYPMFLLSPIANGFIETILPFWNIHREIHN
ncbi:MAG: hypothetical protein IKN91_02235 [Paludibacteraceae bacterium]|nr:hypothetical protein [Paludibacteraceae bacterium]